MLLQLSIGFMVGIAIGSFIPINFGFFIACAFLTILVYFYKYFVSEKERNFVVATSFILIGVLFGMGRMLVSDLYKPSHLDSYVGGKISAEGIIVDEPDIRESNTKLTVKLTNVEGNSVSERVLVSVPIHPEYQYGDKVSLTLVLKEPELIESENGRVFDYKGYLRVRGIWYTSQFTTIKLLSSGNGSPIKTMLFRVKHLFTNSINNTLPEPESSLLSGLLLGGKQSLGKDLLSEFQKTGTSHIVVLSGYNIVIVAESIMDVFKFLPKNISFGAGAVGIILFTILSGGGASAWRAAIMVLVALFAKKMNRDYKVSRALGFAVVLMLAGNPTLLVFDPSFQLSVLATIGLVFVSPFIEPFLKKVPERFGLREIISATIATQITVLPYLVYSTGIVSLVSLPVNILILSTIPLTMFLGFVTGIFGLVSLYLSFIPALFAYSLLWYQLAVVHIGSIVPMGYIKLPAFSPGVLLFTYSVIFIGLYFLKQNKTI
ncbi:MAG: competence protein ComEC [Parcubacteria bacterium C7867-006]|nr:MAG: competence protein ComEC [Parcubacteria bacterium C7867-006]